MPVIDILLDICRFSYETIKLKEYNEYTGVDEIKYSTVIVLKYNISGYVFSKIHPVSEFLMQWSSFEPNTMKIKAVYLSSFLNYIVFQRSNGIKINSLYDLKLKHASEYLNEYGKKVSRDTVKTCEEVLKQFYYFMSKRGFLKHYGTDSFKVIDRKNGPPQIDIDLEDVNYPNKEHRDLLRELPLAQIIPFIEAAINFTPRIALGVYFQFFGGLRVGEIINISRASVERKGISGINGLNIRLKRRNFRTDLKDTNSGGGVKKPRTQFIFPDRDGLIVTILKCHLEKYWAKDGSNALFVDKKGNAMSDSTYRRYFNKLRNMYIDMLISDKNAAVRNEGLRMQSMSWSTHMGRGVFSNMVAEATGNIAMLAKLRGDENYLSALTYLVGTKKARNCINELNTKMYDNMKTFALSEMEDK